MHGDERKSPMTAVVQNHVASLRIREIVAAVLELDLADIDPDALFYENLSADSLEKVEIAVRVEREFKVSLTAEEAAAMNSVAVAIAVLNDKGVVTP
jgi:acyl carrier protein